jgi:hypothetical protein
LPATSSDHCLTALAQLGALRLRASRALISLIDGDTQHVLAEATPFLPLRSSPASRVIAANTLWIGNASFPRHRGICEEVLKLKPRHEADLEPPVLVVNDLEADDRFVGKGWRQNDARFRFYAGVPLISPDGAIIGTYCLFDENPREGLSRNEVEFLLDMSATVMEQLCSHKTRRHQERGALMIRGLTRFVEGEGVLQADLPTRSLLSSPGLYSPPIATSEHTEQIALEVVAPLPESSKDQRQQPGSKAASLQQQNQVTVSSLSPQGSQLQDRSLPADTKRMFSRAANIVREASQLDGIVIFDASIMSQSMDHQERNPSSASQKDSETSSDEQTRHGTRIRRTTRKQIPTTQEDSCTESSSTKPSDFIDNIRLERVSQILGCSTTSGSSFSGHSSQLGDFPESELRKMLKAYPKGKILNFNRLTE